MSCGIHDLGFDQMLGNFIEELMLQRTAEVSATENLAEERRQQGLSTQLLLKFSGF